jgi:hypothetical protein
MDGLDATNAAYEVEYESVGQPVQSRVRSILLPTAYSRYQGIERQQHRRSQDRVVGLLCIAPHKHAYRQLFRYSWIV